jgi:cytochrome c biogenesis protein CcdA
VTFAEPKRAVIYIAYSASLAIPLVLMVLAYARMRRVAEAVA